MNFKWIKKARRSSSGDQIASNHGCWMQSHGLEKGRFLARSSV
jgi:hypothetical protein